MPKSVPIKMTREYSIQGASFKQEEVLTAEIDGASGEARVTVEVAGQDRDVVIPRGYYEQVEREEEALHKVVRALLQEDEELDASGPSEDDITIQWEGPLGSRSVAYYMGKPIATQRGGDDVDAFEDAIVQWMHDENYFPAVWEINDHGNISEYDLSDAFARARQQGVRQGYED